MTKKKEFIHRLARIEKSTSIDGGSKEDYIERVLHSVLREDLSLFDVLQHFKKPENNVVIIVKSVLFEFISEAAACLALLKRLRHPSLPQKKRGSFLNKKGKLSQKSHSARQGGEDETEQIFMQLHLVAMSYAIATVNTVAAASHSSNAISIGFICSNSLNYSVGRYLFSSYYYNVLRI